MLDKPGAVKDGNGGGTYLLVPPDWNGTLPPGIKRTMKGETYFLGTLMHTGAKGLADLPNLEKTEREYKHQPFSSFLKEAAPPAAPKIEASAGSALGGHALA